MKVLYDGLYDEKTIRDLWRDCDAQAHEGYVVRLADKFSYCNFRNSVAKFVRKNHIQTTKHWMAGQQIVRNKLLTSMQ